MSAIPPCPTCGLPWCHCGFHGPTSIPLGLHSLNLEARPVPRPFVMPKTSADPESLYLGFVQHFVLHGYPTLFAGHDYRPEIQEAACRLFGHATVTEDTILQLNRWLQNQCGAEINILGIPLTEVAELLSRAVTGAGEAQTGTTPQPQVDPEALAIAYLFRHPDWSLPEIAEHVGVSRQTLYDWPAFREAAVKVGKLTPRDAKSSSPRRGHKTADGWVEAYDDEE